MVWIPTNDLVVVWLWFCVCNFSAFIPMSEFSDAAVMKKYALKPDAETLDIVNTAARKKTVSYFFFPF